MGLRMKNGNGTAAAANDLQRARFGAFFPRVFACAHSLTGDETNAREVTVEAFSRAFAHPPDLSDDDFALTLFAATRDLCRTENPSVGGRLNSSEREILALIFDARLSREAINRLMGTSEKALSSLLLGALRKLQSARKHAATGPSLRLA